MIRGVRAELRKLRGPMLITTTIVVMLISVFYGVGLQGGASGQLQNALNNLEATAYVPTPEEMGMTAGPQYDEALAEMQAQMEIDNARWVEEIKSGVALARATQQPLGAAGLAAAVSTSALGVFALLIFAAFHVAGEWSRNSIKEVLVQHSGRTRLVVAKVVSTWIAGLWLLFASWVALALWGLISVHAFPLQVDASSDAVGWSLSLLARAPLVILAVAALGVLTGVLLRNALSALSASAVVVLFAAIVAGVVEAITEYSPAVWIAEWMHFQSRPYFSYFVWMESSGQVSQTKAGLFLGGLVLAITAAAVAIMKRRNALS
jgi:ABC-type transport system involved in multi-copper enzyme maturation permease subunit